MGRSNGTLIPFYQETIKPEGETALLGFADNNIFKGDLYDLSLGNWEINSEWTLPKKYKTIISTRCPYFAKDPKEFVGKVYDHLEEGGVAYLDWGLGDHWRFKDYKIGWKTEHEHEFAYEDDNYLWSVIWDDEFATVPEAREFLKNCEKFGYTDLNKAIHDEIPSILNTTHLSYWSNVSVRMLTLWEESPQLYILFKLQK
tara:strand:+ start:258 stop:857 length:600 start_codon:yes stop_codon:yes gene_type:complete